MPLLEHYDRTQFEVVVYFTSAMADDRTAAARTLADQWRDCATLGDEALGDLIVEDRIDILVECTGHMAGTRLIMCGLKPAPIQISFPLYPNTTGVETIDYRIMDPIFAPAGAEAWHSETLIRLPDAHVCYAPLPEDIAPSNPAPFLANGHVTFGSFNNFAKVGPTTAAAWGRIVNAVPHSRLRIKWLGVQTHGADWVMQRFAAAGLDASRIELAAYAPHPYPPYREIDICLDPLFANGGTTTCDALWMGVPVVTMYGRTPFSRVGLCHLTNVGLTELVARDVDEYVGLAVGLAREPDRLSALHRTLRARLAASPLMDGARYTRNLEAEYRRVWTRHCASAG
jgi:protein O-GlcNAc transferase